MHSAQFATNHLAALSTFSSMATLIEPVVGLRAPQEQIRYIGLVTTVDPPGAGKRFFYCVAIKFAACPNSELQHKPTNATATASSLCLKLNSLNL
jgi:hypothetical protein